MSQSSFLEDVMKWETQDCKQKFYEAMPKLINSLESAGDNVIYDVISVILNKFTVVCNADELEESIFARLSQKICESYDAIFEDIGKIIERAKQQIQEIQRQTTILIQHAITIVEGLECSIKHVISQTEELRLDCIHSLLPATMHVVQTSYQHCKDSNEVYGQFLGVISEQLSVLFKKVHSLQMVVINLTDKLLVTSDLTETDQEDLVQVILGLHTIGQVAASLDIKINVTLWKVVSRLASQYKAILQDKIDYSPVLQSLCCHMTSSYDYIGQVMPQEQQGAAGDQKAFTKHLKILGFQMKILVKFVDEFGNELSKDCIGDIYKLMLYLQRYIPPNIEAIHLNKSCIEEIQKQLTNGIEPLLVKLITNRLFMEALTAVQQPSENDKLHVPRCYLLLSIPDLIYNQPLDIQMGWINPTMYPEDTQRSPLLNAIFEAVKNCYTELCVPIMVPSACNSADQGQVSLYQMICIKVCAFVASYSAKHFGLVEQCLLEHVLQPYVHSAMLAIDVWCFLARYGSADLCRDHCVFLTHVLLSTGITPSPQCCHLVCLLKRILKFLAPEHQIDYITEFNVTSHPVLWSIVPLHTFSGHTCQKVVDDIVQSSMNCVNDWVCKDVNTGEATLNMNHCLRCLINVVGNPFITEKHIKQPQYSILVDTSLQLLSILKAENVCRLKIMQSCTCSLLELCAHLMSKCMENIHILKILNFIHSLLMESSKDHSNSCANIKLSSLIWLQYMSKKTLPSSTEQSEILKLLTQVFPTLLSDQNVIVKQTAMQVFAQFAEETPHECVVPECLSSNQQVQQEVVHYLSQLESGTAPAPVDISHIDEQKHLQESFYKIPEQNTYIPEQWPAISDDQKPLSKRMKFEDTAAAVIDEEGLQVCVNKLKDNIVNIQQLTERFTTPHWAKQELQSCYQMLSKLI